MQQFLKFYYWTFMYSSTCFGRPPAHHQELNNCNSSLCLYRWSVVVAVLLVVVGPVQVLIEQET
jgi:nitric oxide reductase large subunit